MTEGQFSGATHTLEEVEKLYGKLLHVSLVRPMEQAYLMELECMLVIFHSSPLLPHSSPKRFRADLEWWIEQFQQPVIARVIPQPVSLYDAYAISDVSSSFGIAITIRDK